ncbi:Oidioi.mRNA.OKI2018_I69.PAR.g9656.t1.cds [Oikopleura dioica]|uniref:Oidioi.mRNA.OKI2018_I69.PAR.g9656.t1.cds n=1 Tax=Oikopleura dioica TaxID=34765 RepID=A0ABN7RQZ8_OIKDI|nr:Oidioi.mRNA.OKI2018_I69.PAR.g9656.t1.cds [Oikopleura dioica]
MNFLFGRRPSRTTTGADENSGRLRKAKHFSSIQNLSSSSSSSANSTLKNSQKYGSTKSLFTHPENEQFDLKNSIDENFEEELKNRDRFDEKPKPLKRKNSLTAGFLRPIRKDRPTCRRQSVAEINCSNFKRSDPARVSSRKRRESNSGRPNTWHEGSTRTQHHPSLTESLDEEAEYLDSNSNISNSDIEADRKSVVSVSEANPSRDISRIPPKRQISAPTTSSRPKKIVKNVMKGQWHEAYPSTFEEIREDKDEVKRQNIIWEVVKSHMDFCEDLLTVKNVYYQGVKTLAPVDERNVPLVDPNELFGNLAEVIAVNDDLACQFQNIRDHRGLVQSIGPSLLEWIPKIVVYADYSKGLVEKRNRLEEVFQMAKIRDYLEAAQQSDFSRKLSIWSMLDAPRTKLPRMKMIIERLQKSTPEDNEDHHLLLHVCEQLDLQTKYLNDCIAEIEFKVKSKSLEYDKSLPHKAHQAPEGATRLLFNGNIKESNKDSELLLFNNCLLIAKRKSKTRLKVTFCEILDNIDLDHPQIQSPKLILKVLQHNKNLKIDALQAIDAMNWHRKFAEAKKSFVESFVSSSPANLIELDGANSPLRIPPGTKRVSEKTERPNSLFGNLFSRNLASRQNSPAIRRKTSGDTDESRQAIEKAKKKHTKSDPLLSNNSAFESEDLIKISDVVTTDSSSLADVSFADSESTNSSTEVTINRSASNLSTMSGTSFMSNSSDGISTHRFGTSFNSNQNPKNQLQANQNPVPKKQYKNSPLWIAAKTSRIQT